MASSVNPFKLLSKYTSAGSEKVQGKVGIQSSQSVEVWPVCPLPWTLPPCELCREGTRWLLADDMVRVNGRVTTGGYNDEPTLNYDHLIISCRRNG